MHERPWLIHYPKAVPAHIQVPEIPVQQLLSDAARDYPQRISLSLADRKLTFAELETQTELAAGNLTGLGVRPGERVGLLAANIPEFVISYFAILKAGAVVAAFNPLYMPGELITLVQDAGVGWMIADGNGYELLRRARGGAALGRAIVVGEDPGLEESDIPFSALRIGNNSALPKVSPQAPAIYQYSGGTTGTPKGAIATHRSLVANTLQFRAWLWNCKMGEETILTAIPLYHVYGMVLAMCLGMALGATLELVPDSRDLEAFQATIAHSRPTIFPAVPGLLGRLAGLSSQASGVSELKALKAVISGAVGLPAGVRENYETLTGVTISEGYGLSEAPTATHCNPVMGRNKPGTIGLPLPDVDARIISLEDEVTPLPAGRAGELVIRAPQVMQAYLNRPEETHQALRDGWLYTGDIAMMDEDGYFTLVDRKKDVIKSGGLQVWPREVEEVLLQHPAIADAGVAGIPDELRGEGIGAWVALKPGCDLTAEELHAWCRQNLAHFKIPNQVTFVDALPRSGVGKLLRRELRKMILS
jgi:long-chain acyl-CoA synthetase